MERLLLLGCSGAGKTTLALELSLILDLPVAHLDELRYDRSWNEAAPEDFAASQRRLLDRSRLICDGNYLSTLPQRLAWADTVIWLDYGPIRCLRRVFARRLRYGPGQHGNGVFVRLNRPFLRYVATYRRDHAPRVRAALDRYAGDCDVIVLRRPRQTAAFLKRLRRERQEGEGA